MNLELIKSWKTKKKTGEELLESFLTLVPIKVLHNLHLLTLEDLSVFLRQNRVQLPGGKQTLIKTSLEVLLIENVAADPLPSKISRALRSLNSRTTQNQLGSAAKDLLRVYQDNSKKYGGTIEDNLHLCERNFELNCDTIQISYDKQNELVHMCLKGMALNVFLGTLKEKNQNVDQHSRI